MPVRVKIASPASSDACSIVYSGGSDQSGSTLAAGTDGRTSAVTAGIALLHAAAAAQASGKRSLGRVTFETVALPWARALSPRNVEEFAHRSSASLVGLGATSDELLASGRETQKCRLRCLSLIGMLGRRPNCSWGPVTLFKKGARAARRSSCKLDRSSCKLDRSSCKLDRSSCKLDRSSCKLDRSSCKPNRRMCLGCRRTNRLRSYTCKPNRCIC